VWGGGKQHFIGAHSHTHTLAHTHTHTLARTHTHRWEVRVWGGGKQHFIGSFTSEMEAARSYDKVGAHGNRMAAAWQLHGNCVVTAW
jgi:hypothetical protein